MNNSNIVTKRFVKCVKQLRDNNTIKTSRQFAQELDCLPQTLSEILNNRRDATVEVLRRAVERHHFNPIFLFTGEGAMFMTPKKAEETTEITKPEPNHQTISEIANHDHNLMLKELKNMQNMLSNLQKQVGQLAENA
jgi:transcriptional regulator with XRE-family HTH domain